MNDKGYKTLEQQIVSLWKSRGMTVKTIEVEYPTWKITVESKMSKKQKETYKRLIKEHGKPISEWENKLLNVYFVEYSFGSIGIEQDGYSHM